MGVLKTPWFDTIHPMTYLIAAQSAVWGLVVSLNVLFDQFSVLEIEDYFWPEELTYVWSFLVLVAGLTILFFYIRDSLDRKRNRISCTAKINLSLWAFGFAAWVAVYSPGMIVVALFNMLAFAYVSLAHKFGRSRHRV